MRQVRTSTQINKVANFVHARLTLNLIADYARLVGVVGEHVESLLLAEREPLKPMLALHYLLHEGLQVGVVGLANDLPAWQPEIVEEAIGCSRTHSELRLLEEQLNSVA